MTETSLELYVLNVVQVEFWFHYVDSSIISGLLKIPYSLYQGSSCLKYYVVAWGCAIYSVFLCTFMILVMGPSKFYLFVIPGEFCI